MTERLSRRAAAGATIVLAAVIATACSSSTEPGDNNPDPCVTRTQLATGSTVNGSLTQADCSSGGRFVDHYNWPATANQAVNITLTTTAFDAFLQVMSEDGSRAIAENDDDPSGGTLSSRIKLIPASGTKRVSATSLNPGETGNYALAVATTNASAQNCELVFAELGVTTQQTLSLTDCSIFPPFNDDQFRVHLAANTRVRITMRSNVVDSWLELYDPNGQLIADDDDSGGGTTGFDAQIVFTVPTGGYHVVAATSASVGETGAYTLTIEVAPAGVQNIGPTGQFQRNGAVARSARKTVGGKLQ